MVCADTYMYGKRESARGGLIWARMMERIGWVVIVGRDENRFSCRWKEGEGAVCLYSSHQIRYV